MLSKLVIGLVFLVSQTVSASPFPQVLIESFDDAKVVIYVNESDISNAPKWQPSDGAPPLSVKNLIRDIKKWNTSNPEFANSTINEFELKPIVHHEKQNRWYYLVEMKTNKNGSSNTHYLAVLMNGKVLAAVKEPASYK